MLKNVLSLRNHRTTEEFEFERIFKDHLVQSFCNEQGHLQLESGCLYSARGKETFHSEESKLARFINM